VDRGPGGRVRSPAGDGQGDYLLIVPEVFRAAVAPLVTLRESQGLKVVVARSRTLNDVYNGGRKSPWAIKRFIRYAYDNWNARFVLLVGDGSEDPQQTLGTSRLRSRPPVSSRDFVPTQRIMGPVPASDPNGESFLQAIVSDAWYVWQVDNDFPFGKPFVPDLHIGRMPVNDLTPDHAVVKKLVNYETIAPTPHRTGGTGWCCLGRRILRQHIRPDRRAQHLLLPVGRAGVQEHQPGDPLDHPRRGGAQAERARAVQPRRLPAAAHRDRHRFVLVPPQSCRCDGRAFITKARATAPPALFTRLAAGRLWWNFQGHANETVLSHEALYANSYNGPAGRQGPAAELRQAVPLHRVLLPSERVRPLQRRTARRRPALHRRGPGEPRRPRRDRVVGLDRLRAAAHERRAAHQHLRSRARCSPIRRAYPQAFDPEGGARVVLGEVITKAELDYYPGPSFYERDDGISYNLLGDPRPASRSVRRRRSSSPTAPR
jgi:hypothetical protein